MLIAWHKREEFLNTFPQMMEFEKWRLARLGEAYDQEKIWEENAFSVTLIEYPPEK